MTPLKIQRAAKNIDAKILTEDGDFDQAFKERYLAYGRPAFDLALLEVVMEEMESFSDHEQQQTVDRVRSICPGLADMLVELFGKGMVKGILAQHNDEKEKSFRKLQGSKAQAPNRRRTNYQAWKMHSAKAERAVALLKKMKEDCDTDIVRGHAGFPSLDDDGKTYLQRLEAEIDDLIRDLEALHADIELSDDGLSATTIKKYIDALKKVKGPSAKQTPRKGGLDGMKEAFERATDPFERNRLKRQIMHEQMVSAVKDWNVRMLSRPGITGQSKTAANSDWDFEDNVDWLRKRIDIKDRK